MITQLGKRTQRLQVLLTQSEMELIDSWRYEHRIPTRAAAIRALLQRGLVSAELSPPVPNRTSSAYHVAADAPGQADGS